MHILLISRDARALPASPALARQHRFTSVRGELAEVQARVVAARPDLVLLCDLEQGEVLVAQVDALCTALPAMALVLLCQDPAPAFLMGVMRAGVREVMPACDEASLTALVTRLQGRQGPRSAQAAQGRCVGILPARGGDGASCVAANLAAAVAGLPGQRVLLMDVALPFGDAELYLTSDAITHDLAEVSEEVERLDAALFEGLTQHVSEQLHFIGSPPSLEQYLQLRPERVLRLIRLAQQHYDLVLLDLGLDAIGLAVLAALDQLVVVGRMRLPSVKGASQLVALWSQLGHAPEQLALVMRAGRERSPLAQPDVEAAVGARVARLLPDDEEAVAESLLQGRAAVLLKPRSALAQAFRAWAAELSGLSIDPSPPRSLWHRLRTR